MGAAGAKGRGRIKREATEAQIIAAFGRVVQRNGLRNVGVNEVLKEAGVGKALLYRYFGGLPGLVTEGLGHKGSVYWMMGRTIEGRALVEASLMLA